MILVGEADPVALEVPIYFPSLADPIYTGVTEHEFTLGEVKLRPSGGAYVNVAVDHLVEKGFGIYAAIATAAQAAHQGKLYVYGAIDGAQPYSGDEDVSTQASAAIIIGETNPAARELAFHLPDKDNPLTPITGHMFASGEVHLMLPGELTFSLADVANVVEKAFGDYALVLTGAQAAALRRGKAYLVVIVDGAQPWRDWYDVVPPFEPRADFTPPVITAISPTPGVSPGSIGGFPASPFAARSVPIVVRVSDDIALEYVLAAVRLFGADAPSAIEETVYRDGELRGRHMISSVVIGISEVTLTIRRDGGWIGRFVALDIDAIDSSGNLTTATFVYELPSGVTASPPAVDLTTVEDASINRLAQQFREDS